MSLNLPELTTNLNIHQTLDDQPSLSASELKTAWDKPVNDVKTYVNDTLLPAIESGVASEVASGVETAKSYTDGAIGDLSFTAENITYDNTSSGMSATNVQSAVNELKTGLNSAGTTASSKSVWDDFVLTSHSSGTLSNGHGGEVTKNITVNKPGYCPIGIVGFASSSTNHYNNTSMGACLQDLYLSTRNQGSCVITGRTFVADNDAWTYSSSFVVHVLWVKIR